MTGTIFDIQHFSLHDGPGIRTTVFLKGCPLRCLWCHNPESQTVAPQLLFTPQRCIGDGACLAVCPLHSLAPDGTHLIDRDQCRACGKCAQECYAEALEISGRTVSVEEVIRDVATDAPYYETSHGGMTLSGGEPLLQPDFSLELLRAAKTQGFSTAIETSGFAAWQTLHQLLPYLDHLMFDVKETDDQRHHALTGVPFAPIRDNLLRLDAEAIPVLVRLPLVPNVNDSPAHLQAVGRLAQQLKHAIGFEIMPYHPLGEGKRQRLGLPPHPFSVPSHDTIHSWKQTLLNAGVNVLNK